MFFKARVEMPKGTSFKYEIDKKTDTLVLDRPLNQEVPHNYGYILGTLEADGDPIDVFILTDTPLVAGSYCTVEVIGGLCCEDNGVEDNKIIAKLKGDIVHGYRRSLIQIKNYLKTYKTGFIIHFEATPEEAIVMVKKARILGEYAPTK